MDRGSSIDAWERIAQSQPRFFPFLRNETTMSEDTQVLQALHMLSRADLTQEGSTFRQVVDWLVHNLFWGYWEKRKVQRQLKMLHKNGKIEKTRLRGQNIYKFVTKSVKRPKFVPDSKTTVNNGVGLAAEERTSTQSTNSTQSTQLTQLTRSTQSTPSSLSKVEQSASKDQQVSGAKWTLSDRKWMVSARSATTNKISPRPCKKSSLSMDEIFSLAPRKKMKIPVVILKIPVVASKSATDDTNLTRKMQQKTSQTEHRVVKLEQIGIGHTADTPPLEAIGSTSVAADAPTVSDKRTLGQPERASQEEGVDNSMAEREDIPEARATGFSEFARFCCKCAVVVLFLRFCSLINSF